MEITFDEGPHKNPKGASPLKYNQNRGVFNQLEINNIGRQTSSNMSK